MKGNFVMTPKEMLDDDRLTALDIAIYDALDYFADNAGEAWPGMILLAQKAKVSRSTLKRALPRLEKAGYIRRERRYKKVGGKELDSTRYKLLFRCCETSVEVLKAGSDRAEVGPDGNDRWVPADTEVGSERAGNDTHITIPKERYCVGDNFPIHSDAAPIVSASVSPEERINGTRKKRLETGIAGNGESFATEHTANVEGCFNELWASYPRKNARGKAKKAFMALFPANLSHGQTEQRLTAISRQFAIFEQEAEQLIARGEDRYIPYLHNWLVREGFADA